MLRRTYTANRRRPIICSSYNMLELKGPQRKGICTSAPDILAELNESVSGKSRQPGGNQGETRSLNQIDALYASLVCFRKSFVEHKAGIHSYLVIQATPIIIRLVR